MAIKQIKKGEVLVFDEEPLPIYEESLYHVDNGRVIPDGTNFIKVYSDTTKYVVHSSELDTLTCKVKDEQGNYLMYLKRRLPIDVVVASDNRGNTIYFTNERSAENSNFKFSFRLGAWHDENSDRFYGDEKTLRYHTSQSRIDRSKLPSFVSDSDEYLIGIEVEKTDYDLRGQDDAWKLLHETSWCKEEDASLNGGGFELVSPILPLFNTDKIIEAINPVAKLVNAKSDDSCGGHITISNRNMNGSDLLESFKHFAPIIYSLYPKRLDNRFCRAKSWSKYFNYSEKYSAFYLKDSYMGGRVEIRLFSRITNQNNLMWRINLLQYLILDKGNLNQLCQKIGCPESFLYKHFAKQYTHTSIGDKLRLIDEYAKKYGTHRNGISPSAKKRINNTMGYEVFSI